jgi:hypothetical protein
MAFVKCISIRELHEDTLYKTGAWLAGDVKKVPDDLAKKMLRHKDVFATASAKEAKGAEEVVIEPPKEENDEVQQAYDAINQMNKEQIKTFVRTKFNMPVDLRKPETQLRAQAIQLVDRFGLA